MTTLPATETLSVVTVYSCPEYVSDWTERFGGDDDSIAIPAPTLADMRDNWSDMDKDLEPRSPDESDADYEARAAEMFENTDAFYEWRDGFWPLMSVAWPLDGDEYVRSHGEPEAIAALIRQHAPSCTLVFLADDTGEGRWCIALRGGGMDLSWAIAAAYVCCGYLPPAELIPNLRGASGECSREAETAVRAAMARVAKVLRYRADDADALAKAPAERR